MTTSYFHNRPPVRWGGAECSERTLFRLQSRTIRRRHPKLRTMSSVTNSASIEGPLIFRFCPIAAADQRVRRTHDAVAPKHNFTASTLIYGDSENTDPLHIKRARES